MDAAKPTIGILFGGCSNEYPVSLHSAAAVMQSVDAKRFDIVAIGIDRSGGWHRYGGDARSIEDDSWLETGRCTPIALPFGQEAHGVIDLSSGTLVHLDAALPILHGRNGEDGSVQGALQLAGIPVVGCGVTGSAVCMDKTISHRIAAAEGVSVPEGALVDIRMSNLEMRHVAERIGYPLFVKPPREGSSMGLSRVESPDCLARALACAFAYDSEAILEREIDGAEIGCAVLESGGTLIVGEPDEIELNGAVFDCIEKYSCEVASIVVPARIAERDALRVKRAAKRLFRALGCTGFARIDFFLASDGRLLFNEANTIPGFTAHSRFPSMLEAAGLSLEEVLTVAIEEALANAETPADAHMLAYA